MWMRPAATMLAAALVAGCSRGEAGAGGGEEKDGEPSAEARQDSTKKVQQALRDSGVTVDTQKIDTGTTTPRPTPVEDDN
jgi:hypothetical protein